VARAVESGSDSGAPTCAGRTARAVLRGYQAGLRRPM